MTMQLPDFEELATLIDNITDLGLLKSLLEIEIKSSEANIVKKVSSDPKYFREGKPLATNFIENTYKYTGIDGELIEKREKLSKVTAELEKAKLKFYLMKDKIEIWRSEQANQRASMI